MLGNLNGLKQLSSLSADFYTSMSAVGLRRVFNDPINYRMMANKFVPFTSNVGIEFVIENAMDIVLGGPTLVTNVKGHFLTNDILIQGFLHVKRESSTTIKMVFVESSTDLTYTNNGIGTVERVIDVPNDMSYFLLYFSLGVTPNPKPPSHWEDERYVRLGISLMSKIDREDIVILFKKSLSSTND